jgi:hypothetical protein
VSGRDTILQSYQLSRFNDITESKVLVLNLQDFAKANLFLLLQFCLIQTLSMAQFCFVCKVNTKAKLYLLNCTVLLVVLLHGWCKLRTELVHFCFYFCKQCYYKSKTFVLDTGILLQGLHKFKDALIAAVLSQDMVVARVPLLDVRKINTSQTPITSYFLLFGNKIVIPALLCHAFVAKMLARVHLLNLIKIHTPQAQSLHSDLWQ